MSLTAKEPMLDVEQRWNSMLAMVEYGLEFRPALDELMNRVRNKFNGYKNIRCLKPAEASALRLTAGDWASLQTLTVLLEPFKKCALILQRSTYPSCGLSIPMLETVIREVEAVKDSAPFGKPEYGAFCGQALLKLKEYKVLIFTDFAKVASLLDPRCRRTLSCCGVDAGEQESLLVRAWVENYGESAGAAAGAEVPKSYFAVLGGAGCRSPDTPLTEVRRWLDEPLIPTHVSSADVAAYMRGIGACFPRIQRMARDILSAPGTAITCESAFSRVGMTTSKRRRRLGDDSIRAIVELQAWKDVPRSSPATTTTTTGANTTGNDSERQPSPARRGRGS
eukprot:GHVU01008530.1.p1 GENE.GHVU01008530.1~~GHVU01008530.1.p1  ORF type:complete len:337 (-),score=31.97 GHVU01008530.1:595-1605(-)